MDVFFGMEQRLRAERDRLWKEAVAADGGLRALGETRESELEEVTYQERLVQLTARLDVRAKKIKDVDAALMRLAGHRYGTCLRCGRQIAIARLQLLPATPFCLRCARREPAARTVSSGRPD